MGLLLERKTIMLRFLMNFQNGVKIDEVVEMVGSDKGVDFEESF